jgi:PIN domain nuclease of toxin-antitoxin system
MKALLDSGVWWRRTLDLPMPPALANFLRDEITEWWLSPLSITEMFYKVAHRKLPAPTRSGWLAEALSGYRLAPFSFEAGRLAGEWPWEHGDPVDRCLAAIASTQGLTLIHTDTVLKDLRGFPQRFFPLKTPSAPRQ